MVKHEGAKTVVYGGKQGVKQQYCGTVGGQSTDFSTIDSEIKTTHLKNHTLAPPDFLTNSVQGITWRLGFGIDDPTQPEEWQNHPADVNLPLTADMCAVSLSCLSAARTDMCCLYSVNKPFAIWELIAKTVL